jgi:hypothetical protein
MKIIFESEAEKELIRAQLEYINKIEGVGDAALALGAVIPLLTMLAKALEKGFEEDAGKCTD